MKKLSKNTIKFIERLKRHNELRTEPVIMDVPSTEPQEVVDILCDLFLGEDWYVVDPLRTSQVNTLILDDILYKYSRAYRKEVRRYNKRKGIRYE